MHFIGLDFSKDVLGERLAEAGFNPSVPTFISLLGVAYYLDYQALFNTLSSLLNSSGSVFELIFDYPELGYRRFTSSSVCPFDKLAASLGEHMGEGFDSQELERKMQEMGYEILRHLGAEDVANMLLADASVFEGVRFVHARATTTNFFSEITQ